MFSFIFAGIKTEKAMADQTGLFRFILNLAAAGRNSGSIIIRKRK